MRFYLGVVLSISCALTHAVGAEWNPRELNTLRSLSLTALTPVPVSPSNRVADNPQAAEFGKKIFFDPRFSKNGKFSCASCHQPDKYFTDQRPVGIGINKTSRNTPTVVASAWSRWFYWDGRRDSLWSQALTPFEAADEMGSSRTHVIWEISQDKHYLRRYEQLFGSLPRELMSKPKQLHASPIGDAQARENWHRIPNKKKNIINTVFANIGKAVAAYERTLVPKVTRFDRYVEQVLGIRDHQIRLSKDEVLGIKLFIDSEQTQCLQCHNGALLTNGGFHNVGSGNFYGKTLDFGRSLGIQAVLIDEFNCLGNYSDAKKEDCAQLRFLDPSQHHVPMDGAFKTPSLRNLGMTAPYFHDGRFSNLLDVLRYYNEPPVDNGPHELKALDFSDGQINSMIAFLKMLDSDE